MARLGMARIVVDSTLMTVVMTVVMAAERTHGERQDEQPSRRAPPSALPQTVHIIS